jgi:hypothetical protein
MSAENINRSLISKYSAQIRENDKQIDKVRRFKSMLYERLVSGFISKEDYKYMKAGYDTDYTRFSEANSALKSELENVTNSTGRRLKWIEHFKKYSELQELDRKVVIQLIRSIRIIDKKTLDITFNFEDEYTAAASFYPNYSDVKEVV